MPEARSRRTHRLLEKPEKRVREVMVTDPVTFRPDDKGRDAAHRFERYDLVNAPVIDAERRLVGRVTVDAVVEHIRETTDSERLSRAGLREEEDLFAPTTCATSTPRRSS
jgi:magnesium transporter